MVAISINILSKVVQIVVRGFAYSDIEPCHFFLYFINAYMRIIVERHADIGMAHHILQSFRVHPRVCHTRTEGMPE